MSISTSCPCTCYGKCNSRNGNALACSSSSAQDFCMSFLSLVNTSPPTFLVLISTPSPPTLTQSRYNHLPHLTTPTNTTPQRLCSRRRPPLLLHSNRQSARHALGRLLPLDLGVYRGKPRHRLRLRPVSKIPHHTSATQTLPISHLCFKS
jgi:hypothetical protein